MKQKTLREMMIEDVAIANNVGDGEIAGAREGDDPVIDKTQQRKWVDETGKTCAGHRVFETDSDTIRAHKDGKHPRHRYDRYFSEADKVSGRADEVRAYGRANSKKNIVLKDGRTGAMTFVRRRGALGEALETSQQLLNEAITAENLDKVVAQAGALAQVLHVMNEFYAGSKLPSIGEIERIAHTAVLKQLEGELKEFVKMYKHIGK